MRGSVRGWLTPLFWTHGETEHPVQGVAEEPAQLTAPLTVAAYVHHASGEGDIPAPLGCPLSHSVIRKRWDGDPSVRGRGSPAGLQRLLGGIHTEPRSNRGQKQPQGPRNISGRRTRPGEEAYFPLRRTHSRMTTTLGLWLLHAVPGLPTGLFFHPKQLLALELAKGDHRQKGGE